MRFECYDFAFSTGEKHIRLNRFIFYVEILNSFCFFTLLLQMDTSFNSINSYLDFFATEYFVCYNSGLDLKFVIKHFSILFLIAQF
jgi:hypothetical protein